MSVYFNVRLCTKVAAMLILVQYYTLESVANSLLLTLVPGKFEINHTEKKWLSMTSVYSSNFIEFKRKTQYQYALATTPTPLPLPPPWHQSHTVGTSKPLWEQF